MKQKKRQIQTQSNKSTNNKIKQIKYKTKLKKLNKQ